jgi:hypothetical protein
MFIDSTMYPALRSSGARCLRQWGARAANISLLWSEEDPFNGRAFYKHSVPTGRGD